MHILIKRNAVDKMLFVLVVISAIIYTTCEMWCMGMEIATTFNKIWRIMETRCGVSLFAARDPSALLASIKPALNICSTEDETVVLNAVVFCISL
jgi:hypothetical protein